MLKKLRIPMLVAASIASASAAYGPAPAAPVSSHSAWVVGLGYGQMFGMKATDNSANGDTGNKFHKVNKPTFFEVSLFNCNNGFGALFMTTAKKKDILKSETKDGTFETYSATGEYSFTAYMLGFQKEIANNMTATLGAGLSDQKYTDTGVEAKADGEFAYRASLDYHMGLSGKTSVYARVGYLDQKDFEFVTGKKVSGTGFFAAAGVQMEL